MQLFPPCWTRYAAASLLLLAASATDALAEQGAYHFLYTNHFFTPERDRLGFRVIARPVSPGLRGEIVVRAFRQDDKLVLEVRDTGAGLTGAPPRPGGGVGLSNLRARLRSIYDGRAQVQLLENQPCGINVRLLLPLKANAPSTLPAP